MYLLDGRQAPPNNPKEDEMNMFNETGRLDMMSVEREARRLQAEALTQGVRNMGRWLRGAKRTAPNENGQAV